MLLLVGLIVGVFIIYRKYKNKPTHQITVQEDSTEKVNINTRAFYLRWSALYLLGKKYYSYAYKIKK